MPSQHKNQRKKMLKELKKKPLNAAAALALEKKRLIAEAQAE